MGLGPEKKPSTGEVQDFGAWYFVRDWLDTQTKLQARIDSRVMGGVFNLPDTVIEVTGDPLRVKGRMRLIGAGQDATVIKAANGANLPAVLHNDDIENGNDRLHLAHVTVDGNRTNQAGGGHVGLYLWRVPDLILEHITIQNCDGHGAHIMGGGAQTRRLHLTNVTARGNASRGVSVGWATRDVVWFNVLAEENDGDGVWIDHSEAHVMKVIARLNGGRGIYLRNLHSSQLNGLTAKSNDGHGIHAQGVVGSIGADWLAVANGRGSEKDADIYFTQDDSLSYGTTKNFTLNGAQAVGNSSYIGGGPIQVAHGVYVEDGVTENVRLLNLQVETSGTVGRIRLPNAEPGDSLLVTEVVPGAAELSVVRGAIT